jgi:hypothetical protein
MALSLLPTYNRAFDTHRVNEGKSVKLFTPLILVLSLSAALPAFAADAEAGLVAVKQLGGVNGQALACADKDAAAHARLLMLTHAPKTQRFGAAYEEATQEAYLAQTRAAGACPDAKTLAGRIDEVAQRLRATLPAAQPAAK